MELFLLGAILPPCWDHALRYVCVRYTRISQILTLGALAGFLWSLAFKFFW